MKSKLLTLFGLALMLSALNIHAQEDVQSPEMIATAIAHKVIGPLSDFPALTPEELAAMAEEDMKVKRNEDLQIRNYPFYEQFKNDGPGPGVQREMGTKASRGILQNWAGNTTTSYPPDDNGAAGPNHYMQTINVRYTIYDKVGTLVAGPTNLNSFFTGLPGGSNNDGDPIVLYDEQADRWLMAEFSGYPGPPSYMLIAISQTSDPTGTWDAWSFVMNGFPDYMKFGVWRDGYYMGTNTYSGSDIYVFERDEMLAGGSSPQMVQFNNPNRPNSGFHCVLPVDNDGTFAPAGTPGMFMTINDNAWGGSTNDQLWLFELDVDWDTPTSSTFSRVQTIDVASFDSNFGSSWNNITQPGTTQKLDAISQILMHRVQYRNFGSSQNIVCNHTVDVGGNQAGIRWYELEYSGSSWGVRQYGTYAPDSDSRWMGSIAMNTNREIAVGYSVSSSSTYPSIRYAGQSSTENALASGTLDIAETSIFEGSSSQTAYNRWGDYSNMSIDPVDDHVFWFTSQYFQGNHVKGTRIASFEFEAPPLAADFEADDTSPETGQEVYFTDLSAGSIDSWSWTFTPNTVTYTQSTSSSSQNPVVTFDTEGLYTVELTITGGGGSNTMTKVDYINAIEALLAPEAEFEADNTNPSLTDEVNFTDLSINDPTTWAWSFTPNTITYLEGTDAASQNPVVQFNASGFYTVSLTASNSVGSDEEVKVDYINAYEGLTTTASASPQEICEGDWTQLNAFPAGGSGSYTYTWTSDPVGFTSSLQNPVAYPEVNTTFNVEVNDGSNTAQAEVSVTVNALPVITLGDWPEYLCNIDVPPVQLMATPAGGTYTGPGVSATGVFISSLADTGWNVITYTYEDINSCSNAAQDSIYVDDCVGVSEIGVDEQSVKLYPNPNMGSFTLDSEENMDKIEIIDQNGRMVMMRKINGTSTPISALRSKGFYFIRVYFESQGGKPEVVTKEFIIK